MSTVNQQNNYDVLTCDRAELLLVHDVSTGEAHRFINQPVSGQILVAGQEYQNYYYTLGDERLPASGNLTRQNAHEFTVVNFTNNTAYVFGDTRLPNMPNFTTEITVIGSKYDSDYWTNEDGDIITSDQITAVNSGSSEVICSYEQVKLVRQCFDGYFIIDAGSNNYPNAYILLHCDNIDFTKIDEQTYTARVDYTIVDVPENIAHRWTWNWGRLRSEFADWGSVKNSFSDWGSVLNYR